MSEELRSVVQKRLNIALSVATLTVPLLYLIGYFFEYGYSSVFGLDPSYFPKSIQQYLVSAFSVFQGGLWSSLSVIRENYGIVAVYSLVIFFASVATLAIVNMFPKTKKKYDQIKSRENFKYISFPLIMAGITFFLPYLVISILVVISILPIVSFPYGQNLARESIDEYIDCDLDRMKTDQWCIYLMKNGKEVDKGLYIDRSDRYVAFWNRKTVVYPLSDEVIILKNGKANRD